MKLITNTGGERVIDELRSCVESGSTLDAASPGFSIFAFGELRELLQKLRACRLVLPALPAMGLGLLGSPSDRRARNRLQSRWLAKQCSEWIRKKVELRGTATPPPQSTLIVGDAQDRRVRAISGHCPLTTEGLGLTPGDQLSLIQCAEGAAELAMFGQWFDAHWSRLPASPEPKSALLSALGELVEHKAPSLVYHSTLLQVFKDLGDELDEDQIVKSATGIRDTAVWQKLYRFQRDGVIGAIDKLERHRGCIIADSVGLGKTFEALAVIKYYELRNDRVLVLCPKRLRDNWTIYTVNDRRNSLARDRFHYDVLNHTDLSRDAGTSGDIDLSHINWGNYDLVVIDESHNFRNKASHRTRETRYGRLMEKIIKAGVRTRVLMLSATPVNNRLADLKNQIAFITEGNDAALVGHGIPSVDRTVAIAQAQFNQWLRMPEEERRPARLMDMLGFDYFKLLDLLTIARSRKHVERYYGTAETGRFPERLPPRNFKPDVDRQGGFRPVKEINDEIRLLTLGAYAPLRYVLPHKQAEYQRLYDTKVRGGQSFFRQVDREESMVHLLRINLLKRMESSVASFALTLQRQLADVDALLHKLDARMDFMEELSIEDIEVDDPTMETLLVGRKVKVLLNDVDRLKWRQDLTEDRGRLASLFSAAMQVGASRDAKLDTLRGIIEEKVRHPLNPGNRKVIVFTAFADTADYLYRELAEWARSELGIESAVVSGARPNRTTLPGLRHDLGTILSAFAPRSKERPPEFASEGEIDLLIATDCISEGQNLQDCDYLVNYDIHWNPVRIIQRFGRIDRIGSPNERIQLVNFWPNLQLEEYINLERRVSGRMVLLDISATGEENLIEHQSGDQMNDLEYRRKQLIKLQDTVIDLEDLSSGVSIADLTLNDFRMDLAGALKADAVALGRLPLGSLAVTTASGDGAIPPGVVFCLRAEGAAATAPVDPGYPLAPHYLVHVGDDGAVVLPFNRARQLLDRIRRLCLGHDLPDAAACARHDRATREGRDMADYQSLLATAVASLRGATEERVIASLFTPGGTRATKGDFVGIDDFEVVSWFVIVPASAPDGV